MAKTQLKKNFAFLKYCASVSPKDRKKLLKKASKDQIKSLCEVTLNVAKKNIEVPLRLKNRLCKDKKIIRLLADRKGSLLKKKQILVQKGGFLPALLRTVLPMIASALISE